MTDTIGDMIRKRRKLFKRLRRCGNWLSLKTRVSEIVAERKARCNQHILQGFRSNTDTKNFHRVVKRLLGENSPPKWVPEAMYPDKSKKGSSRGSCWLF